jgi:hypothetical protein
VSELILLGGPPAIGKTTVARFVWHSLDRSAWLDGDAVWKIRPFEVTPASTQLAEANITAVLGNYLESGYNYVLFSWVLHRLDLIERIVAPLADLAEEVHQFTLVATPQALRERFELDPKRGPLSDLALRRLNEATSLPTNQIDTTRLSPSEVAGIILAQIGAV